MCQVELDLRYMNLYAETIFTCWCNVVTLIYFPLYNRNESFLLCKRFTSALATEYNADVRCNKQKKEINLCTIITRQLKRIMRLN